MNNRHLKRGLGHQGNANEISEGITMRYHARIGEWRLSRSKNKAKQINTKQPMLAIVRRKGNPNILLLRMQTNRVHIENNVKIPNKKKS